MGKDKVKVGVRVRPFNAREKAIVSSGGSNATIIQVKEDSNQIVLVHPSSSSALNNNNSSGNIKSFTFDHVFDMDGNQGEVFENLGKDLLSSAFEGYNACLFAYGQTGSGKSYTMLGSSEQRGVIPRLCDAMFNQIAEESESSKRSKNVNTGDFDESSSDPNVFKVEVSFMEIYNEKVRDLLVANKTSLKVREHSIAGPYVDGLSILAVKSAEDVATLMAEGNKSRTIAATNMNSESSRSHAVFTIVLTQTMTDEGSGVTGEKVSRISLVDLAGSERATKTGAVGERLKEGSNINKSLTTLGLVISKLAEGCIGGNSKDSKTFIPYRDSVLTWLLKDNLGGNSRTIMIATVSPSADNYEETLSTLRYADRAKRIVNNAVVNEDPNAKLIRELQAEVKQLRELLKSHVSDTVLNEQLNQSEKLMRQMSEPWEERLQRSEQASQERQAALEKMGISVQQSGISVETNRFYLVNLNADPALNELLVYYLKEDRTLVGRPDGAGPPDIQLTGLGIESLHCELIIEPDQSLHLIPYPKALTCVNGEKVEKRKLLQHGDRILWGNHHFFRLNSPARAISVTLQLHPNVVSAVDHETDDSSSRTDYEQASSEFYMKQFVTCDPIHEAVAKLESKHQKDKEVALEKQRQELYAAANDYGRICAERILERQFNALMHVLSPTSSIAPTLPWDASSYIQQQQQLQQQTVSNSVQITTARNSRMAEGLKLLKEFLLKANHMVHEANEIASTMKIDVKYSVTLLIPPNNLTPNRPKGALVTEPSIKVEKEGHFHQIWSMEKLHNRLVDMRELYEDFCSQEEEEEHEHNEFSFSFFEPDQPHVLLGIANVFLQALFYDDVTLKYPVPVISQQGEIVGRLHIEIAKISGQIEDVNSTKNISKTTDTSLYEDYEDEDDLLLDQEINEPKTVTVRVTVRHLAGVSSSHYVFCQYVFCDNVVVVPPQTTTSVVRLDHTRYFTIPVSEEFVDYCSESALSFEVWGHRGNQITSANSLLENPTSTNNETNNNSVTDRWKEVTSQIKLWVEIQELNENGEYVPVEVDYTQPCGTGGVHQLKQGLQRRIQISVETNGTVGQLPIVCDEIDQVSLGAITPRSTTLQRPLDSYQEEDLTLLRDRWGEALKRRREYLDFHLQELAKKQNKSIEDVEREKSLVSQWLLLTEERNAVLVPTPDSGVPGAPTNSNFKPDLGIEQHMPIVFLDIPEDILSVDSHSPHSPPIATGLTAGLNSLLPKEHEAPFIALPLIRKSYGDFYSAWSDQRMSTESWALVSWDSSVHDCSQLNKPTPQGETIYVILRIALRLSHPVAMDCILRKRICLFVKRNRASLAERLKNRFSVKRPEDSEQERSKRRTGVTYQIVSHLPKSSEQLETRESLANLAVSHGESYIEEYLRSISTVDSILNLDRMRQSVHLREEQVKNRPRNSMNKSFQQQNGGPSSSSSVGGFMRKTLSVPNISQLFIGSSPSSNNLVGGLSKLPQINGGTGLHLLSTAAAANKSASPGLNSSLGGGGGESNNIIRRSTRPIRSESLANLSGFTSPPSSSINSPSQSQQQQDEEQQQQNQSLQTPRPSSLSLGYTNTQILGSNNATPHSSKWTTLMTTVMEEESSGYGSQKSSEDSPTTTG